MQETWDRLHKYKLKEALLAVRPGLAAGDTRVWLFLQLTEPCLGLDVVQPSTGLLRDESFFVKLIHVAVKCPCFVTLKSKNYSSPHQISRVG